MTRVVIIDIQGIVVNSGNDVIDRHIKYAMELRKNSAGAKLYVLTRGVEVKYSKEDYFEIIFTGSAYEFHKAGARLIKSYDAPTLLVCGDPWISFFSSLIIQLFARMKCRTQVQLHADVGSKVWTGLNFKNRIKATLLPFSLGRANQIRCVSEIQKHNVIKMIKKEMSDVVVIPVPINVDENALSEEKIQTNYSIAIVGRIHKDRGLLEFIRIAKIISGRFTNLEILVVGDGPHKEWFMSELRFAGLFPKTSFLGHKSQNELSSLWRTFGCLASLAPSEAYGRSAREAILHGVPVIGKASSGLSELDSMLRGAGIWFIDGKDDNQIAKMYEEALVTHIPMEVRKSIIRENKKLYQNLSRAWIHAASKKF
jgi:glycosyltransferase involved in cell wall biosynthesis